MYSSCQPPSLRKSTYPMAFLPKEISSHLSYMDDNFETRVQSYVPELNQINWRRSKSQSIDNNLGIKHNIHKGTGAFLIKRTCRYFIINFRFRRAIVPESYQATQRSTTRATITSSNVRKNENAILRTRRNRASHGFLPISYERNQVSKPDF